MQPISTHTPSAQAACADACLTCHRICNETFARHCLVHGGKHVAAGHARLMLDCGEICQVSAGFLLRGSNLHGATCRACAEVCQACATSCRALQDPVMQACADACTRCAEECQGMAAAA